MQAYTYMQIYLTSFVIKDEFNMHFDSVLLVLISLQRRSDYNILYGYMDIFIIKI